MYSVFRVGGDLDGKELLRTECLADAINAAYKADHELEGEEGFLGTAIWDEEKDEEVIDW